MKHCLLAGMFALLLLSCASTPPPPPSSGIYAGVGSPPVIPTNRVIHTIPYSQETRVNPQEIDPREFTASQEVIADVKTRIGSQFFRQFYLQWQVEKPRWDHPITISEKPAMGSGFAVVITVITQNQAVWGKVIRPGSKMIQEAAHEAALAMQQIAQQNQ
jgi:hypothetical protein